MKKKIDILFVLGFLTALAFVFLELYREVASGELPINDVCIGGSVLLLLTFAFLINNDLKFLPVYLSTSVSAILSLYGLMFLLIGLYVLWEIIVRYLNRKKKNSP